MNRVAHLLLAVVLMVPVGQGIVGTEIEPAEHVPVTDGGSPGSLVIETAGDLGVGERRALATALEAEHVVSATALVHVKGIVAWAADVRDAIQATAGLPGVRSVEHIPPGHLSLGDSPCQTGSGTTAPSAPWWFDEVTRIQEARATNQGAGTIVAVLDTGVNVSHPEIDGAWLGDQADVSTGQAWFDPRESASATPVDNCGHGTAVTGLAVGDTVGVAPQATFIGARITDEDHTPNASYAFQVFDSLLDLPGDLRPDVLVGSWGWEQNATDAPNKTTVRMFASYLDQLRDAGTLPIFAAGNGGGDGVSNVEIPADLPQAVAVDSVYSDGQEAGRDGPARHNSTGHLLPPAERNQVKPDLAAPGQGVVAPWTDGSYQEVNGTSFASPVAAGVALLVQAADRAGPQLDADNLERSLLAGSNTRFWTPGTGDAGPEVRPSNDIGYGIVDAKNTLRHAERADRVLLVGDYAGTNEDLLAGEGYEVDTLQIPSEDEDPPAADAALENVREDLDRYGTLVFANLPQDVPTKAFSKLVSDARGETSRNEVRTGFVAISDPGEDETDGFQHYINGMLTPDNRVHWQHPADQSVAVEVAQATSLFPGAGVGDSLDLRTATTDGQYALDGFDAPDITPHAYNDSAWFSRQHDEIGVLTGDGLAPVYLLGNVGVSSVNPDAQRTSTAKNAILNAIASSRQVLDPDEVTPNHPHAIDADVLMVGDADRRVSQAAKRVVDADEVAHVAARDLASVEETLYQEDPRVIVYNDIDPSDVSGVTLADVEAARAGTDTAAVVLGGADSNALDRMASHAGYAVETQTASTIEVVHPHIINDFSKTGREINLARTARTFTVDDPSAWRLPFNGSDGAPATLAVQYESNRPDVAVVGFGAALGDAPPGPNETDTVSSAIEWAFRHPLNTPLSLDDETELKTSKWTRETPDGIVLNGLRLDDGAHVRIANTTSNVTIRNTWWKKADTDLSLDEKPPGLILVNNEGHVVVEGNRIQRRDPGIMVADTPNLDIHHNTFVSNERALDRDSSASSVQEAPRINATLNYYNHVDPDNVDTSQSLPGHLGFAEGIAEGVNLVHPAFQVVPYYTQEDRSQVFPPEDRTEYLPDVGTSQSFALNPTTLVDDQIPLDGDLLMVHRADRSFTLTTSGDDGTTTATPLTAPEDWSRVRLDPRDTDQVVTVEATQGRGEFVLASDPDAIPRTATVHEYETFDQDPPPGWQLHEFATVGDSEGAKGTPGYAWFPQYSGNMTHDLTVDVHRLGVSLYMRLHDETNHGAISLYANANTSRPVVELPFNGTQFHTSNWSTTLATPDLTPETWHKVDVRLTPPTALVLLDNTPVGEVPVSNVPTADRTRQDLTLKIGGTGPFLKMDEVRITHGEPLPGLVAREDLEDGLGQIETTSGGGGGGGGGDGKVVLMKTRDADTEDPGTETRLVEMQRTSSAPSSDASGPAFDESRFATTSGSASYGSGASIYVSSGATGSEADDGGKAITMDLPGALRRYVFQEHVSLPEDGTFEAYRLLDLQDADNRSILRLSLEDENAFLDVQGAQSYPNIIELQEQRWHKVAVAVDHDTFTVLVDNEPVLEGPIANDNPPARWLAGTGWGGVVFDNLQFGRFAVSDAEYSASGTLDPSWSVTSTSSDGGVTMTDQVPIGGLNDEVVEQPLLSTHTIRLLAPAAEQSMTYLERPIQNFDEIVEFETRIYLPPEDTLRPAYDGFHLFRLEDAQGDLAYTLWLEDDDLQPEVERRWGSDGSVEDLELKRGRWYPITARLQPDGSANLWINGTALPPLPSGDKPASLVVGDLSDEVSLNTGETGTGAIYIDDLEQREVNRQPSASWTSPDAYQTIGGVTQVAGTAEDPDSTDAVSWINLTVEQDGQKVGGPMQAGGTTDWTLAFNTTPHPKGWYTLTATPSDGLNAGDTIKRTVQIDNRPVGGIDAPAEGETIGGIYEFEGTAEPRFPISDGEKVDDLEYRIEDRWGPREWNNLSVDETGRWNISFDTRPEFSSNCCGDYTLTVRAENWLDSRTWKRTFKIDNSPAMRLDAPTDLSYVGGEVTFEGRVWDRYVIGENDTFEMFEVKVVDDYRDTGWTAVAWPPEEGVNYWDFWIDTHQLENGWHTFKMRGQEDGDIRTVEKPFYVDNKPRLSVDLPPSGATVGDKIVVRGNVRDPNPGDYWNEFVERMEGRTDGGPWKWARAENETGPGALDFRVPFEASNLTDGEHSIQLRAKDGVSATWHNLTVTVQNGAFIQLEDGDVRYDYLAGDGDGDAYTLDLPTDVTRVRVVLDAFGYQPDASLYMGQGDVTNSSYTFTSEGDGTHEVLDVDAADGLTGGTWTLRAEAANWPSDYRVDVTIETSGVCTGICPAT